MTIVIPSISDNLNQTDDVANLLLMTSLTEIALDSIAILFISGVLQGVRGTQMQASGKKRRDANIIFDLDESQNQDFEAHVQNMTYKVRNKIYKLCKFIIFIN